MNKPIKILLSTDSATLHTGLAETTRLVFTELLKNNPGKYQIEQLGWFHFNNRVGSLGEKVPWKIHPTKVNQDGKPDMADKYGQLTFEKVRAEFKPDIVYTNGDIWCFQHLLNSPTRNSFRLATYYTIDGEPYWGRDLEPNKSSLWGKDLINSDKIIVLTEYGREVLKGSCPELASKDIDVIYHPSDLSRFSVVSEEAKKFARKRFMPGIPDNAFVMGWIGRNQYRKQNYKMWETLSHIKKGNYIECLDCGRITRFEIDRSTRKERELGRLRLYEEDYTYDCCWYCKSTNIEQGKPLSDVYLWSHCNTNDPGWHIKDMMHQWDIGSSVIHAQNLKQAFGFSPKDLAQLITSFDCMLYLSGGEGFGVPPYEAIASGVPVIYSNYSSHSDFCKKAGLPVRVDLIPELNFSINRAFADVNHAIEQVLYAYRNREEMKELGLQGHEFCKTKTPKIIASQWDNLFTDMMKEPIGACNNSKIYADII